MSAARTDQTPGAAPGLLTRPGRGGHVAGRSGRGWGALVLAGLAGTLLGAGAGALASTARPVTYSATVQEYIRVNPNGSTADPIEPEKVRSYAGMVRSQRVLGPVITAQRLNTTVDALADRVASVNPDGSLLVEITVTDESPQTARRLAEAIGKQFASAVTQLEGRSIAAQPGEAEQTGSSLEVDTVPAVQVTAIGLPRLVTTEGSRLPWILAGALLGLLAGLAVRVGLRRRDPWIDDPADLVPVTGAAPLGIVDDPRGGRRGAGAAVSAARSIAANLRFSDVDHPPRCLVIAGLYPEGPQTMVAADLAIGLARTGQKVVLVEADLAAFRLRSELRIDGRTGLTSILTGDNDLDQVLVEWRDGVQVLAGGPLPPNPAQVMRSEQLASLLRVLKVRFDYVVLDGPPMLATPVAAELAGRADGAVLVITRGEHRAGEVREAVEALDRVDARLLGTIFCDAPLREGLRRGARSRRSSDPEAPPAEGRGYEPRGFEAPARRQTAGGRSNGRGSGRSLEEFDDPSIVPLLLASPDELGREVEALPRQEQAPAWGDHRPSAAGSGRDGVQDVVRPAPRPGGGPGGGPGPVPGSAPGLVPAPVTPRRVPLVQVPVPRGDADGDGSAPPEMVTLPPDDSAFGDLYEDALPEDPFPPARGSGGGRGPGPAWGSAAPGQGSAPGSAPGPATGPGPSGYPGSPAGPAGGGHPRYSGPDGQPGRRDDRPAARADLPQQRQTTLTDEPFPQVIPAPSLVPPVVLPSVGVAPTVAQTPPAGLAPSPSPSVAPMLPRPPSAPAQPAAAAHPSTPQGHPAPARPYPASWPELRREYEEPRPAYLDDPDLERPYQPRQAAEAPAEQPLPRRSVNRSTHSDAYDPAPYESSYPAEPYRAEPYAAEPHPATGHRSAGHRAEPYRAESYRAEPYAAEPYPAEAYQPEAYAAPYQPTHQPEPQPAEGYRSEPHSTEYRAGQDLRDPRPAGYPFPESELPLPRRTVPPVARPGMTVLPGPAPVGGPTGTGRRRARDVEPEPFLGAEPRDIPWGDQQDERYRPY